MYGNSDGFLKEISRSVGRRKPEIERRISAYRRGWVSGIPSVMVTVDESLALELETMTRERNELAAELAVLKAEAKAASAAPKRKP